MSWNLSHDGVIIVRRPAQKQISERTQDLLFRWWIASSPNCFFGHLIISVSWSSNLRGIIWRYFQVTVPVVFFLLLKTHQFRRLSLEQQYCLRTLVYLCNAIPFICTLQRSAVFVECTLSSPASQSQVGDLAENFKEGLPNKKSKWNHSVVTK